MLDLVTYPAIEGESSDQLNIFFTFGRGFSTSIMIIFCIYFFTLFCVHQQNDFTSLFNNFLFQHWMLFGMNVSRDVKSNNKPGYDQT